VDLSRDLEAASTAAYSACPVSLRKNVVENEAARQFVGEKDVEMGIQGEKGTVVGIEIEIERGNTLNDEESMRLVGRRGGVWRVWKVGA